MATNRYKGTARSCTWTKTFPSTATAVTIAGIKKVHFDPQISVKTDAADGDLMPTTVFWDYQDPMIAVESIDAYAFGTLTPDMRGTLVYSIADASGGLTTAAGGKLYTILNAFLKACPIDHPYREFGTAAATFGTISADGTTSPVSVSAL